MKRVDGSASSRSTSSFSVRRSRRSFLQNLCLSAIRLRVLPHASRSHVECASLHQPFEREQEQVLEGLRELVSSHGRRTSEVFLSLMSTFSSVTRTQVVFMTTTILPYETILCISHTPTNQNRGHLDESQSLCTTQRTLTQSTAKTLPSEAPSFTRSLLRCLHQIMSFDWRRSVYIQCRSRL